MDYKLLPLLSLNKGLKINFIDSFDEHSKDFHYMINN